MTNQEAVNNIKALLAQSVSDMHYSNNAESIDVKAVYARQAKAGATVASALIEYARHLT